MSPTKFLFFVFIGFMTTFTINMVIRIWIIHRKQVFWSYQWWLLEVIAQQNRIDREEAGKLGSYEAMKRAIDYAQARISTYHRTGDPAYKKTWRPWHRPQDYYPDGFPWIAPIEERPHGPEGDRQAS